MLGKKASVKQVLSELKKHKVPSHMILLPTQAAMLELFL